MISPKNRFSETGISTDHVEGLDEPLISGRPVTQFIPMQVKQALSKNDSPDLPLNYSVNPYQGCEHGCIYCYARNSHQYWGYDSGLGFETNILVKKGIVRQLKQAFEKRGYVPQTIMLSGNTDCYQPAEKQFKLTRGILELCLEYRHPISIITKNALIFRDMDVLNALASSKLVHVYFSINHLDPRLKNLLEPRTAIASKKLEVIRQFSDAGIPCGVMVAPIIPGINMGDISQIIKKSAEAGALSAGYTVVRLNGQIREVFEDWLQTHFPDRSAKVMHQVESLHGGKVNDTEWGRRIRGAGQLADVIHQLFSQAAKKHLSGRRMPEYDFSGFRGNGQYKLFP